jgi:hypothetical protein
MLLQTSSAFAMDGLLCALDMLSLLDRSPTGCEELGVAALYVNATLQRCAAKDHNAIVLVLRILRSERDVDESTTTATAGSISSL